MYLHFLSNFIPASAQSPVSQSISRKAIQPKTSRRNYIALAQSTENSVVSMHWKNVLNASIGFIDEQEMLETVHPKTQKTKRLSWWM